MSTARSIRGQRADGLSGLPKGWLVFALLVTLVSACISMAIRAASADASYQYYCAILVSPQSVCSGYVEQYVTGRGQNEGYYTGSGYVGVCERIDVSSLGTISRVCTTAQDNNNYAVSPTINNAAYDYLNWYFYVGNNDQSHSHTINGLASYNF